MARAGPPAPTCPRGSGVSVGGESWVLALANRPFLSVRLRGGLLKSACGFILIFKGFCHISNLTPRFLSGLFCSSESFPGRYIFYCCPGDFDFVSQTSAFLPNVLSAACLACPSHWGSPQAGSNTSISAVGVGRRGFLQGGVPAGQLRTGGAQVSGSLDHWPWPADFPRDGPPGSRLEGGTWPLGFRGQWCRVLRWAVGMGLQLPHQVRRSVLPTGQRPAIWGTDGPVPHGLQALRQQAAPGAGRSLGPWRRGAGRALPPSLRHARDRGVPGHCGRDGAAGGRRDVPGSPR